MKNKLSTWQKIIISFLLVGLLGCFLLLFDSMQNAVIFFFEKVALQRHLNHPENVYPLLQVAAFFGIFSCFLFIVVALFYKQLLSVTDSFLNKALTKQICGITIKEILVKQPFLLIFFIFILYLVKNIFLIIHIIGFDGLVVGLTFLIHISVFLFMYRKRDKSIIPILI